MNKLITATKRLLFLAIFALFALQVSAQGSKGNSITHCDPTFTNDISAIVCAAGVNGVSYVTVNGDCTGTPGCDDYFDMDLLAGQTIEMTFCSNGGSAIFDTGLSVWDGVTQEDCNDDFCGLQSELSYTATVAGTYRVRIGGFGGGSGPYTLAIRSTGAVTGCSAAAVVPTLGQWSIIILGLMLLTFGLVSVKNRRNETAMA